MCDICADVLELLQRYENEVKKGELRVLSRQEMNHFCTFLQNWIQRQCTCCFKDPKNFDRFNSVVQGFILNIIEILQQIVKDVKSLKYSEPHPNDAISSEHKKSDGKNNEKDSKEKVKLSSLQETEKESKKALVNKDSTTKDVLSLEEKEKYICIFSKVFLLNFPLYVAFKHSMQSKLDEMEIPVYLFRNVCFFSDKGGLKLLVASFEGTDPEILPLSLAHALSTLVANLKLWMNIGTIMQPLMLARSGVIRYLCQIKDSHLRAAGKRNLFEFMWATVKDPLDNHTSFDKEGMDLAFKYFNCCTLTMRLAGIAQINNHINMFNELCQNESLSDAENIGSSLANWLIENKIIECIFGPNLHVELLKQSHIILNFLAMEGRITNEHIDTIWCAAQLKHCSRQVLDLLPPLIKNLEVSPVLHLYKLLCNIETKEQTEQTLLLASALIKFIWLHGNSSSSTMASELRDHQNPNSPFSVLVKGSLHMGVNSGDLTRKREPSSSERSVSIEASNSEDERSDIRHVRVVNEMNSQVSDHPRSSIEGSGGSPPSSPCDIEQCKQSPNKPCHRHQNGRKWHPVCPGHVRPPVFVAGAVENSSSGEESELSSVTDDSLHSDTDAGDCSEDPAEISRPPLMENSEDSGRECNKLCNIWSQKIIRRKRARLVANKKQRIMNKRTTKAELSEDESVENPHKNPAMRCVSPSKDIEGENKTFVNSRNHKLINSLPGKKSIHRQQAPEILPQLVKVALEREENVAGFSDNIDNDMYECGQYLATQRHAPPSGDFVEDILSPDDGSCNSSHVSNKSEKNLADFDGEESGCEDELAQLAQVQLHPMAQRLNNMACMYSPQIHGGKHFLGHSARDNLGNHFQLESVCESGQTLLWDILQDDKIGQLSEGLAVEAEKILCNLVCWCTDKMIRMKFIEGCLQNIANNRSVIMSMRLLPKLFSSIQQFRGSSDTHSVTLYSHKDAIQVRLHFLTNVFSTTGSPEIFQLNHEQVDILWQCLAQDTECADELFGWLLNQAKGKDQYAMNISLFKHVLLEKMPQLPPESTSMMALNLLQQLSSLAHLATASYDTPSSAADVNGMQQLWGIALRALNTDVSMAAIQYLNNYYINVHHGTLEREEEFIQHCMDNLMKASEQTKEAEDSNLMIIQRALLLLKTHIEAFRRRYAYHLRKWQLNGRGMNSHRSSILEKQASVLRIICQPAGLSEKTTIEVQSCDTVADLRAEVTQWWEHLQAKIKKQSVSETKDSASRMNTGGNICHAFGTMLSDGPIRMISQGQELTSDLDEKTLAELGMKDHQLVFVSVGALRQSRRREGLEPASTLPPPPRDRLPVIILLKPTYFEQLFGLMQHLCSFTSYSESGATLPHTKAQVLSRRVWEILMMLPTSPTMLQGFRKLNKVSDPSDSEAKAYLESLINPKSPQKLMYCLQIVDSLRHSKGMNLESVSPKEKLVEKETTPWNLKFVKCGGLNHLFQIFMSGVLQASDEGYWSEWKQDCMTCLLRLIYQFGVETLEEDALNGESDLPKKRFKRTRKTSNDKLLIPKLNQVMLHVMSETENVLNTILSLFLEAASPTDPNQYKTGFWGRSQIVSCAMTLLVSWAFSQPKVHTHFFRYPLLETLLKRLVLDDPEPALRREACTGLYRLCLGSNVDGHTGTHFVAPLLKKLLSFLSVAQNMKQPHSDEEDKEPYGPGCKDYFWLICRLVDSLDEEYFLRNSNEKSLDIENLATYLGESITNRDCREARHSTVEDDGLKGLINLMTVIMKHNPSFKCSPQGKKLVLHLYDALFALPSPKQRHLPKCKSQSVRSSAYDLIVEMLKGSLENFNILQEKLMKQHTPESHNPYPWDYWPHDDGRADCGYVGLTNLGATCYLASCIQHLYMLPEARASIVSAKIDENCKHENTLRELQKMFAYLLESERKAYNPRSFCKVYTMDHQVLNTGEQKDMAEFFTNLISKLEEMTPELKELVKTLFCGIISNNVVSLDCPHISRTLEEFYTLRCQVADMRNLLDSIDEITVKDTLEGDNMYTCSQCGKKVRAEKRACLKKLPKILCFNMMRYTFSFVTNSKEKVNTHFSFPFQLDMSNYMEKNLIPKQHIDNGDNAGLEEEDECFEYELIGVTVHTGNAEGGHYYCFIRERNSPGKDKWYFFNDSEVKNFDPVHIAAECFGGEVTSKTYDSVTDKFMDFSFEKTNSAYMLFYERIIPNADNYKPKFHNSEDNPNHLPQIELSPELAEWIWQDNMQFLQDKSLFEHTYFDFMWQICSYIPQTLAGHNDIILLSAKLGTSFVLETLIHAKEKPTISQWIELLTKQFSASQPACEWFLDHMAENSWWPVQILIKCPNQVVRQLFQRLCIHVINQLKPVHCTMYLQPYSDSEESSDGDNSQIGQYSCVTKFIKKLVSLVEHGAKQHLKHLTEYFAFLLEFAKMGEEECSFLLSIEAISSIVSFYLGQKSSDYVEVLSDEEEEEDDDIVTAVDDKYKSASLEKMISLIALLVEKSRDEERLQLSTNDFNAVAGGKSFPFLYQQIRDGINIRQTCNLIFSLCRWNDALAVMIINMIFASITKQQEQNASFFKLLTLMVEFVGGPPGMPPFTNLILQRIWETAEYCPQQCMEWLTMQVPKNKIAHQWVLQSMDNWVERFLIAHNVQRVRNVVALLLISLVPSNQFRQTYRAARSVMMPHKDILMSNDAIEVMHKIYDLLLKLLKKAKMYVDPAIHGTTKLTSYFAVMTYCLLSKNEKLMFSPYFIDLWNLFQPKLSEPAIPIHMNKQALLLFWYHVCIDCPENVKLIIQNPHVTKNIAFNYILADHEEQEVIVFNRCMLPAYYGLLRLCCQQSRTFTRQLANHQNIQWAFKNITPYTTQYSAAISELFKLMKLFVTKHSDATETEIREIHNFKRTTIRLYLGVLDARACWSTLINVLRILVETTEDRIFVIYNNGLPLLFQAFYTLHMMYHEATACHVTSDMVDLLAIVQDLLKTARANRDTIELHNWLASWKDQPDIMRKLLTLLNSFTPPELRQICIEILREVVLLYPTESLTTLVPLLASCHATFQENNSAGSTGPFFPRRGQKLLPTKTSVRPPRPVVQMFLHANQLECAKNVDEDYDRQLLEFYLPYHQFVDMLCRVAISNEFITIDLVSLSAMLAIEGAPLHLPIFPKLWLDIIHTEMGKEFIQLLCNSSYFIDYLESVLLDERLCLNQSSIFQVFSVLLPKVSEQVINDQMLSLVSSLMTSFVKSFEETELTKQAYKLNGDLRALCLIFSVEPPNEVPTEFIKIMNRLIEICDQFIKCEDCDNNELNVVDNEKIQDNKEEEATTSADDQRAIKRQKLNSPGSSPKNEDNSEQWAELLLKSASKLVSILQGDDS
nr:ubiquitin carboxyl-terminal hydrolase 34 [Parasteatoda tepidariorum]